MKTKWAGIAGLLIAIVLMAAGCDEGINDWNSSARVSGWVFTDPSHTQGLPGVQVIIESDFDSPTAYEGPDRWTVTDAAGHFEGAVFLGHQDTLYVYVADLQVGYYWNDKAFVWSGGISVAPGSMFTLPPVDTTMFAPIVGGGR
jgi:hypothetical protein